MYLIDGYLPAILRTVTARGALVLVAEPGAGKTTRVPPALLDVVRGRVIVLEPRRVAARMAATFVANERGEAIGETVGYSVRFESRVSAATRLEFMTEGVLQRRLERDPHLEGVGAVVLDELHERSLHADLALALLQRLRASERPDLLLVAMSATLESEKVATLLDAEVISVPGRLFPVEVEYLPDSARRDVPLPRRVAAALGRACASGLAGDVLVFLPGLGEIRRTEEACAALAAAEDLLICPLHGGLALTEQARALAPDAMKRRKIILATNIAESSLTVEGVTTVIDCGLARMAAVLPRSGLPVLDTWPISKASAVQRAGRAGRVRAGTCLRLFSAADFHGRHDHDAPEILRSDLAELALAVRAAGVRSAGELGWLDAPPAPAIAAADRLLTRLGAIDAEGLLTPLGARIARLPAPPRLAASILAAAQRGAGDAACLAAALITEAERGGDDVEELGALGTARSRHSQRVEQARQQLGQALRGVAPGNAKKAADPARELRMAFLVGHPDRVAARRGGDQLLLAAGGSARLAGGGHGLEGDFFVVLDARGAGGGEAVVTKVVAIERDWLLDLHAEWIRDVQSCDWNADAERVETREQMVYGSIVLTESSNKKPRGEAVAALLFEKAIAAGVAAFADADAVEHFLARVAFASQHDERVPAPREDELEQSLRHLAAGCSSFAELREAGLLAGLRASLESRSPGAGALVHALAPEQVTLPGGKRLQVHYDRRQPPHVESRLQDFFGSVQGPAVARGKVPLVLHLLAPNRRPLQITTDLAGFWERHYPAIRKQLRQRYSRHDWPEDPRTAVPAAPRRRPRR